MEREPEKDETWGRSVRAEIGAKDRFGRHFLPGLCTDGETFGTEYGH